MYYVDLDPFVVHTIASAVGVLLFASYHLYCILNKEKTPKGKDRIFNSVKVFTLAGSIPESLYIGLAIHTATCLEINPLVVWVGLLFWVSMAILQLWEIFFPSIPSQDSIIQN